MFYSLPLHFLARKEESKVLPVILTEPVGIFVIASSAESTSPTLFLSRENSYLLLPKKGNFLCVNDPLLTVVLSIFFETEGISQNSRIFRLLSPENWSFLSKSYS